MGPRLKEANTDGLHGKRTSDVQNTIYESSSMKGLESYLQRIREVYDQEVQCEEKCGFVLGNTSGDLDSFLCSIVFGYFLTELNGWTEIHYAVLNLSKEQLGRRGDLQQALRFVLGWPQEVNVEHLFLCRDSPRVVALFQEARPSWMTLPQITLVDHHWEQCAHGYPEWLRSCVTRVIDHHGIDPSMDDTVYATLMQWDGGPLYCVGSTRIGSCASLVAVAVCSSSAAQRLLSTTKVPLSDTVHKALGVTIAKDTRGFYAQYRGTLWGTVDERAFSLVTQSCDRAKMLDDYMKVVRSFISAIKETLVTMTIPALLNYDAKMFSYPGNIIVFYASFCVSLHLLLTCLEKREEDFINGFYAFCAQRGAGVLILMSSDAHSSTQPQRELGVFVPCITPQHVKGNVHTIRFAIDAVVGLCCRHSHDRITQYGHIAIATLHCTLHVGGKAPPSAFCAL